jgi:uncharacterized protein YfiM (DUF2279 family)
VNANGQMTWQSKQPFNHPLKKRETMKYFAKSGIAIAAAVLATSALADVSFDANIETNTTKASSQNVDNGGRVEINAKAELLKNGDNFVNAKGTFEVPLTGAAMGIADAWIHLGNSAVDVKVGRFEAVDLFPLGKDVVVQAASSGPNAINGYNAGLLRGRFTEGQLHTAIGLNAAEGLRFEMGVVTKKDTTTSVYGVRPTVTYNAGALTLRAGAESYRTAGSADERRTGFGLSAGYALGESSNLNIHYAKNSKADAQSFGLNLTMGAAGIGLVQKKDAEDEESTVYAAYSFPLLGVKGASITPAISHSKADGFDDVTAVRVRMNYAF